MLDASQPKQTGNTMDIWLWVKIKPPRDRFCVHLPGFHFELLFLTHPHMARASPGNLNMDPNRETHKASLCHGGHGRTSGTLKQRLELWELQTDQEMSDWSETSPRIAAEPCPKRVVIPYVASLSLRRFLTQPYAHRAFAYAAHGLQVGLAQPLRQTDRMQFRGSGLREHFFLSRR